jgi:small subunit ribosomal protein S20
VPNIKSAVKRVNVNEKKNLRNRMVKSQLSTAIKKFNAAIDLNNAELAEKLLPQTYAIIDSSATKGVIHFNAAARKKAQVASRLADLKSGKIVIAAKVDNKTRIAEKRAKEDAARLATRKATADARAKRAADKAEKEAPKKAVKPDKKTDKKVEKKTDVKADKKPAKKVEPAAEEQTDKKPVKKTKKAE